MRKKTVIGREVLEVYRKASPSAIPIESKDAFQKFCSGQEQLWQQFLKIPLRALRGAEICDYGCGTGEVDVFLGLAGAKVKGIDFNPDSIARAKKLSERFSLSQKLEFITGDVHSPDFKGSQADFAISFGVLPHVANPGKVFINMVDTVKDGGFLVVGFVEELGIVQRLLHRSIVRAICGFKEDEVIQVARDAFPDHLRRSMRFGQRTERSVVFDYLVNRHMYGLSLEKVLSWFELNNVAYYSCWPCIELPFQISPYTSGTLPLMHPVFKEYRALLRLRWLFAQDEDVPVFNNIAKSFQSSGLTKSVDTLSLHFARLVQQQTGKWGQNDLKRYRKVSGEIVKELDDLFEQSGKLFSRELAQAFAALDKVLHNIVRLQQKRTKKFNPIPGLFRELNGLGTMYLAGISGKHNFGKMRRLK